MKTATKNIDLGFRPHRYQQAMDAAMLLCRFFVAVCCRRFGKTEFAIIKLIGSGLRCNLPDGRYAYLAPYLNQAKDVAWDRLKAYTMKLPGYSCNEAELWVKFRNLGGSWSRIRLYGADNAKSLRGRYLDGLVMDEVAQIGAYVWNVIIRPMLVDRHGWVLFIGTPEGENLLKEMWDRAENEAGWGRMMFRASEIDLPWITEEEKAKVRREQGDDFYNQEFECDFYANVYNIMIPLADVDAACKRVIVHEAELRGSPKVMGVDVARFGHHRSAIARRWGRLWYPVERWRGLNNMDLAMKVVSLANEWKPDAIAIDGGRGEGVIDRCRQLGWDVIEVNFGGKAPNPHYANQRTFQWAAMAEAVKTNAVLPHAPGSEHPDSELKTELSTQTYRMRGDQQEMNPKEGDPEENATKRKPYKSPDLGDACSLLYFAPVKPKQVDDDIRRVLETSQSFSQPEYVPY